MKTENLIKIAHYHSLYGESNLYTSEDHKHPKKKQSACISFYQWMLKTLMNWSEQYYEHGSYRNWMF